MKRGLLVIDCSARVRPVPRGPALGAGSLICPFRPDGPEDVGLSSARLARLKTAMQGYVDRREIAGVVTLIARHGKVAHFESIGYRDAEAKMPMTPDTIFRQASMTKPIVAVATLMLFEEGRLQLSDPISKWLPEFKDMKVLRPGLAGGYTTVPARDSDHRPASAHTYERAAER